MSRTVEATNRMDFAANPLMFYLLAKDGGKSDMLPILWAMSQNK